MDSFIKRANEVKGTTIVKNLKKRFIDGAYCNSVGSALEEISKEIEDGSVVSWGGSMTLKEIEIRTVLEKKQCQIIDRDTAANIQERTERMRAAMLSDYYLTSTNAITLDGELVNIDYNGNRVGAICFGPKRVLVIAGMNKVVQDVQAAMSRIRNRACVPNCIRLGKNTPCAQTGHCTECVSSDTLCGQVLITRVSMVKDRIKVFLVDEHLGW